MPANRDKQSALTVTLTGLAALASAMGVGRFGFTPLLPVMQADSGLSLSQAAWLAGSNYMGYLIGALACSAAPPAPRNSVRVGLLAVAIFTLAMGATASYGAWVALRLAAGAASAYVLVGMSAWALHGLSELGRSAWSGWVFWYGTFGFGYIIPATFLPAMARALIADPSIFGWIWPVFGATAAASTAIAALWLRRVTVRNLWAASLVVMAAGVLAPVLVASVESLLLAAMCVGGTFMVITMAGMQEARRLAGAAAPRLMAAMTTALALGQLAGPIIVAMAASDQAMGIAGPSVFAAPVLLAGAWTLRRPEPGGAAPELGHERKQT